MNISNLFNFSAFGNTNPARTAVKSAQELSPLAQAVQRADLRVQGEVAANTAQLSSFGQLKSAVADVESAAHTAAGLSANASPSTLKKALGSLVAALNTATAVAKAAAAVPGASEVADSAKRVEQDFQALVEGDSTVTESLAKMGVSLKNGTLVIQDHALDEAVTQDPSAMQSRLKNMAQTIEKTAYAELDTHGRVTDSLTTLKRAAQVLQAQQSALQSAAQATAAYSGGKTAAYGVGAYQSNIG